MRLCLWNVHAIMRTSILSVFTAFKFLFYFPTVSINIVLYYRGQEVWFVIVLVIRHFLFFFSAGHVWLWEWTRNCLLACLLLSLRVCCFWILVWQHWPAFVLLHGNSQTVVSCSDSIAASWQKLWTSANTFKPGLLMKNDPISESCLEFTGNEM